MPRLPDDVVKEELFPVIFPSSLIENEAFWFFDKEMEEGKVWW